MNGDHVERNRVQRTPLHIARVRAAPTSLIPFHDLAYPGLDAETTDAMHEGLSACGFRVHHARLTPPTGELWAVEFPFTSMYRRALDG
jgi:hypothetical protein